MVGSDKKKFEKCRILRLAKNHQIQGLSVHRPDIYGNFKIHCRRWSVVIAFLF